MAGSPPTTPRIDWTGPPLTVIGLSGKIPAPLEPAALEALQQAELIIGSERHLEAVLGHNPKAKTRPYPSPLGELRTLLEHHNGKRVVLLASGDPLYYGIGGYLGRTLAQADLRFLPALSSIQLAFSRLGLCWQDARVVSLHGRPLQRLRSRLGSGRLLALLTDHRSQPQAIARELHTARLEESQIWICEALETPTERIRTFSVAELLALKGNLEVDPLHVTIVHTRGEGGVQPEFPGIPDHLFSTGDLPGRGMISKREVRLNALSLLQPRAGDVGWDVGAGCGGLAVEWARWNPLGQVYAVEHHNRRIDYLRHNRDQFGVDANLRVVEGTAPNALHSLPRPNAVFIGGSEGALYSLLEYCWQQLLPGGRLVASAVTEQSRVDLMNFCASDTLSTIECEWVQVQVSRGETLGSHLVLRPKAPVLLLSVHKPYTPNPEPSNEPC
ncbi:precorrin-6y C5,15-methyltransferase (decarboxylating) subunit CbiE [Aestuariirhabdus litorea]|uniref:Precorrin-6y C5,15-methyltransferase (Decarboxylating) subunit CbiE n=1 Tax=Aestuariirhabdus litorea TaxID=2528527 RepID=A0A3P3VRB4_9GAMM|nr:precorrin-6y C5,15-methyltransferase (decarboxylating) subunit CbiE [Aestuariirhabdus litorea]RRJ84518.1 precorrin-6y C5,15-methyltransferase (decarboxylating) subunit CbiE [Aestuariirhabdus litorea]RWW97743.1 precorrin-6y C5,15-methyltransferase (decarboxylating) subunit CbiE [Endozoicomonadaceae bacterium GTF-13]